MAIPPRLKWSCRRGMLELDVILGKFLQGQYLQLSTAEQACFVKLLSCEDQELYDWLTGKSQASQPDLSHMIEKIRKYVDTSH